MFNLREKSENIVRNRNYEMKMETVDMVDEKQN